MLHDEINVPFGKKLRVGFTGAQGTGKTSVSDRLAEWYPQDIVQVPSTARQLHRAGYKINREAGELDQLLTTLHRISVEDETYDNADSSTVTIGDRTPLDSVAYTMYQMSYEWPQRDRAIYIRN